MRISDWSSDVCSSDLPPSAAAGAERARANDAGLDDGRTVDGDRRAAAATEAAVAARDDVERVEIVAREADAAFAVGRGRDVGCGERAARQVDRGKDRQSTRLNSSH